MIPSPHLKAVVLPLHRHSPKHADAVDAKNARLISNDGLHLSSPARPGPNDPSVRLQGADLPVCPSRFPLVVQRRPHGTGRP